MTMRENFKAVMNFQKPTRLPAIEWAIWWDKTINRWKAEGMPDNVNVMEYFGLDIHQQYWLNPRAKAPRAKYHGSGLLQNLTPAAYRELKPHLFPSDAVQRSREHIIEQTKQQQNGDIIIWITLEGFFWFPREIMGIHNHLLAFYDEPELMHTMNKDLLEYNLRVLDEFCQLCVPDFMTFAEDMSYNNGPMISKPLFDQFMVPYYNDIIPKLNEYGIEIVVDTDGDLTQLIPWFEELGITAFLPLERQAGVDLAQIRKRHPRLRLLGGFDKTVMHLGEDALRAEFERLLPVMQQGGFIPSVDHQTPPAVSLDDYKLYVRLLKEYCANFLTK